MRVAMCMMLCIMAMMVCYTMAQTTDGSSSLDDPNIKCDPSRCQSCWGACMKKQRNSPACYRHCNANWNCTGKCDKPKTYDNDEFDSVASMSSSPNGDITDDIIILDEASIDNDDNAPNKTCKVAACKSCFGGCMARKPSNPSRCYGRCNSQFHCVGQCRQPKISDDDNDNDDELIIDVITSDDSINDDYAENDDNITDDNAANKTCNPMNCRSCYSACMKKLPNPTVCYKRCNKQYNCTKKCERFPHDLHDATSSSSSSPPLSSVATSYDDTSVDDQLINDDDSTDNNAANITCNPSRCRNCWGACMKKTKNPTACYKHCDKQWNCTGKCEKFDSDEHDATSSSSSPSVAASSAPETTSSSSFGSQCDTFQCDECVRWCMRQPPHNINQCFHSCGKQWDCKAHCGHSPQEPSSPSISPA